MEEENKKKISVIKIMIFILLALFLYIIFTGGLRGHMNEESFEALTHEKAKEMALEAEKEACGVRFYEPGKHIVFLEFNNDYYTIEVPDGYEIFDTKYTSNAWSGSSSIIYLRNTEKVAVEGKYNEAYIDKYKCSYNHFGAINKDE